MTSRPLSRHGSLNTTPAATPMGRDASDGTKHETKFSIEFTPSSAASLASGESSHSWLTHTTEDVLNRMDSHDGHSHSRVNAVVFSHSLGTDVVVSLCNRTFDQLALPVYQKTSPTANREGEFVGVVDIMDCALFTLRALQKNKGATPSARSPTNALLPASITSSISSSSSSSPFAASAAQHSSSNGAATFEEVLDVNSDASLLADLTGNNPFVPLDTTQKKSLLHVVKMFSTGVTRVAVLEGGKARCDEKNFKGLISHLSVLEYLVHHKCELSGIGSKTLFELRGLSPTAGAQPTLDWNEATTIQALLSWMNHGQAAQMGSFPLTYKGIFVDALTSWDVAQLMKSRLKREFYQSAAEFKHSLRVRQAKIAQQHLHTALHGRHSSLASSHSGSASGAASTTTSRPTSATPSRSSSRRGSREALLPNIVMAAIAAEKEKQSHSPQNSVAFTDSHASIATTETNGDDDSQSLTSSRQSLHSRGSSNSALNLPETGLRIPLRKRPSLDGEIGGLDEFDKARQVIKEERSKPLLPRINSRKSSRDTSPDPQYQQLNSNASTTSLSSISSSSTLATTTSEAPPMILRGSSRRASLPLNAFSPHGSLNTFAATAKNVVSPVHRMGTSSGTSTPTSNLSPAGTSGAFNFGSAQRTGTPGATGTPSMGGRRITGEFQSAANNIMMASGSGNGSTSSRRSGTFATSIPTHLLNETAAPAASGSRRGEGSVSSMMHRRGGDGSNGGDDELSQLERQVSSRQSFGSSAEEDPATTRSRKRATLPTFSTSSGSGVSSTLSPNSVTAASILGRFKISPTHGAAAAARSEEYAASLRDFAAGSGNNNNLMHAANLEYSHAQVAQLSHVNHGMLVTGETTLSEAVHKMLSQRSTCLWKVNSSGHLQAYFTSTDVFKLLMQFVPAAELETLSIESLSATASKVKISDFGLNI